MKTISREKSVLTGKKNLEHLQTIKKVPVFFGCTTKPIKDDLYADMTWKIDPESGIIQLSELIQPDILYMEQHVDAIGKTWADHNNSFSEYVANNAGDKIIEIGGGSGKIAKLILSKDNSRMYTVIEPNPTFEEESNLKIIRGFFERKIFKDLDRHSTIIFSQLLEHVYDPIEFINDIYDLIAEGEKIVFSYPNLELWFKRKYTNAINFEHTMLLTDYFVDWILINAGFSILEKHQYKDHSFFYTARKETKKIKRFIVNKYEYYKKLFEEYVQYYEQEIEHLNSIINESSSEVFLFGAHIFSQHLITCGLNENIIECILDNSPLKQGKRLYGSKLTVKSPEALRGLDKPVVILRAGLYNDEIARDIIDNINSDTVFI